MRTDDPDTSVEAAEKAAMGASKVRPVVLRLLRDKGPLTHDELIAAYRALVEVSPGTPRASASGIRTRLSELRRIGLVVEDPTGSGLSEFGNRAKRWVAVDTTTGVVFGSPYSQAHLDARGKTRGHAA